MPINKIKEVLKSVQDLHDRAQKQLLRDQSDYGFGLVDGLFAALTVLHMLEDQ